MKKTLVAILVSVSFPAYAQSSPLDKAGDMIAVCIGALTSLNVYSKQNGHVAMYDASLVSGRQFVLMLDEAVKNGYSAQRGGGVIGVTVKRDFDGKMLETSLNCIKILEATKK